MSGSMTWREYITDSGTPFSIKVDKSNANFVSVFTGQVLCNSRGSNWECLPKSITPRIIYAYNPSSPNEKKRLIVGNISSIQDDRFYYGGLILQEGFGTGGFWIITGYTGEKIHRMPTYFNQPDTGLIDGTVGQ